MDVPETMSTTQLAQFRLICRLPHGFGFLRMISMPFCRIGREEFDKSRLNVLVEFMPLVRRGFLVSQQS